MILTYRYRLLPLKSQHRALEQLLRAQYELYNGHNASLNILRAGIGAGALNLTGWR